MHLPIRRKDAYTPRIHTIYNVLILPVGRSFIPLIGGGIYRFGIAETIHKEHDFLLLDLFLLIHGLLRILDGRAPLSRIFFLKPLEIFNDYIGHGAIVIKDILVFRDIPKRLLMLFHQRLDLKADQFVKPHLQNGCGLALREPEHSRHLPGYG